MRWLGSAEGYFGVTPRFAGCAGHAQDVSGVLAAYSFSQPWSDRFDSRLDLFYDWSERNLSRTEDDRTRANVLGWRTGAVLWNPWTPAESLGVEFGADFDYRYAEEYANKLDGVVVADNNMSGRSVYESSLFGQAKWDMGPVRLVGGARLTYDELFGENVSARATAIWSLNEQNAVKFMAGQSFRAPSLFESYFSTPDRTVFGNEELQPETVDSVELAYQYSRGGFHGQATAYYAWYHDTIQRVTRGVTLPDGTVIPNASVRGDEARLGRRPQLVQHHPQPARPVGHEHHRRVELLGTGHSRRQGQGFRGQGRA